MKKSYDQIIEKIFTKNYVNGKISIQFSRDELEQTAKELGLPRPKNLGDIIYSYKFRNQLPEAIRNTAPDGKYWIIKNVGKAQYNFVLSDIDTIEPDKLLVSTKIPEATPTIVKKYSLSDEQALLAIVRYNRLIDIFLGIACYSLQNHLRTTVVGIGQIETDELYVGVDKSGNQFIIPVEAKGGNDKLGISQLEQDIEMCKQKYPHLLCRSIACQFMDSDIVALFEFREIDGEIKKIQEKHYIIVNASEIKESDLETYCKLNLSDNK